KSLEKIIFSMNEVLKEVGASLLCGDTKVVEEKIGIFLTTAGIGVMNRALENNLEILRNERSYNSNFVKDGGLGNGDFIIVTGTIGDHGISLMSLRENLSFETELKSDVAPIWDVVERAMRVGGITSMKDPTRGGVSAALNEISKKSQVGIEIDEKKVPIKREVQAASEMLGLNFYDVACEGKVLIGVLEEYAEDVLEEIKKTKYGRNAQIIGKASKNHKKVILKTKIGGKRILEAPLGDPVPRVC
ncbi:MAG: AIR synthase-related protein, partial [Candidatus Methanofastidiosia archaeon]